MLRSDPHAPSLLLCSAFSTSYYYFSIAKCSSYDAMHTIMGNIKDIILKGLLGRRYSDAIRKHEGDVNGWWVGLSGEDLPFHFSAADHAAFERALVLIADSTPSRMTGSTFKKLLKASKQSRAHALFVLASPYGRC